MGLEEYKTLLLFQGTSVSFFLKFMEFEYTATPRADVQAVSARAQVNSRKRDAGFMAEQRRGAGVSAINTSRRNVRPSAVRSCPPMQTVLLPILRLQDVKFFSNVRPAAPPRAPPLEMDENVVNGSRIAAPSYWILCSQLATPIESNRDKFEIGNDVSVHRSTSANQISGHRTLRPCRHGSGNQSRLEAPRVHFIGIT